MLHSSDVPQADVLNDVIKSVRFIANNPGCTDEEIGDYIGKVDRQGRYYRDAAELLGFIEHNENRHWSTANGDYYLSLSSDEQVAYLKECVMNLKVFRLALDVIINNPGCTKAAIKKMLKKEGISESLSGRRNSSIVEWLVYLRIIKRTGDSLYA
ncbi:hypothetical protein YV30_24060 [Salmonella enterica subsp. enterica]|nr:hypothetical protein [Salmonella enterica subsp. enterica serovar Typhi]ECH9276524.1 hypothetical protein [Salmonella enterica subsp. enterica]